MPRHIPPALKEHLKSGARTVCWLMRIDPVMPDTQPYGITELDVDIEYGGMVYRAPMGMEPSVAVNTADLSTDNMEVKSLLPVYDVPVTEEDINAGKYDFARYTIYLVNYEDLSMGHIVLKHGTIGRVTMRDDGLSVINEARALAAQLKQTVCEKDSLTCRAIFGSQPPGSEIPGPQVDWGWCGYPAESLLVAGTVEEVSLEPHSRFKVGPFVEAADALVPGMIWFRSGRNEGRSIEITANTADGWIDVSYDLPYPVQIGDEVEYRVDCTKHARDDAKGCRRHFGAEWVLHFRGEPDIPIGDEGAMNTPGAGVGPGDGGYTQEPMTRIQ